MPNEALGTYTPSSQLTPEQRAAIQALIDAQAAAGATPEQIALAQKLIAYKPPDVAGFMSKFKSLSIPEQLAIVNRVNPNFASDAALNMGLNVDGSTFMLGNGQPRGSSSAGGKWQKRLSEYFTPDGTRDFNQYLIDLQQAQKNAEERLATGKDLSNLAGDITQMQEAYTRITDEFTKPLSQGAPEVFKQISNLENTYQDPFDKLASDAKHESDLQLASFGNAPAQSQSTVNTVNFPTTNLQPGSTGAAVKQLQDFLVAQGHMTQAQVNTGYGTYGPQTTAAVKAWQEANGVDNSTGPGYWGPRSIAAATQSSSATQPTTTTNNQAKTSAPTATNTLKAYDTTNNYAVVYVQPGVYVPGVSLTPAPATTTPSTSTQPAAPQTTNIPTNTNYSTAFETYWGNVQPTFEKSEANKALMWEQWQTMGSPDGTVPATTPENNALKPGEYQQYLDKYIAANYTPSQAVNAVNELLGDRVNTIPEAEKELTIPPAPVDNTTDTNGWSLVPPDFSTITDEARRKWTIEKYLDGAAVYLNGKRYKQDVSGTTPEMYVEPEPVEEPTTPAAQTPSYTDIGNWDDFTFDGGAMGVVRLDPTRPNDLYLIDAATKTIQKFASPEAVANYQPLNGATVEQLDAAGRIPTISISLLLNKGFTQPPDASGTIQSDGTDPMFQAKQDASITFAHYYNQTPTVQKNSDAHLMLDGFLTVAQQAGVTPSTISNIRNNPNLYAFYLNAVAYGGYSFNDVFKDLKRRELSASGDPSVSNVMIINPNLSKTEYANTVGGQAANSIPSLTVPAQYAEQDSSVFNLPIFQLPKEAFNFLTPLLDVTSPEFKAEVDKIKSLYHDVILQNLESNNERTHALAQEQWRMLKQQIESKYKIKLADNALNAWDQINTLGTTMSGANIYESGIHQEARDKMLQRVRKQDDLLRQTRTDDETAKRREYFLKYATATEMKNGVYDQNGQLIYSAPSQSELQSWALVPSQEDLNFFTLENLRSLAPNESDAYLQAIIDANIDTSSGTPLYRSETNATLMNNRLTTLKDKTSYQTATALQNSLDAEEAAARPFTEGQIGERATSLSEILPASSGYTAPAAQPAQPVAGTNPAQSVASTLQQQLTAQQTAAQTAARTTAPTVTTTNIDPFIPNTQDYTAPAAQTAQAAADLVKNYNPKNYSGPSVVDYLKGIGYDSSLTNRQKLASNYGIKNYDYVSGTGNTALLKAMRGF